MTAPRPPRPWPGVRDATAPAASCPQVGYDEEFDPIVAGEEDCLYVDVVAPARPRHDGRLPVVVWLHGGNLASGGAAEFDGARLATGGDVVVVTVNYRLGALGFLSAGAFDAEGTTSGNYGLLDQAEALRWVRRNAAAFGGDPRKVTLAGQSAGARSVCTHLASPGSRRLFQQAIVQSGACANPVMNKADADHKGAEAIRTLGCADVGGARDVAECLRATPVSDLVLELASPGLPVTAERREDLWGPVAGTPYLPLQPIDAIRRGSAAGIPLLVGSTHDEMRGTRPGPPPGPDWGGIRVRGSHRVRSRRSEGAEEVFRRRLRHSCGGAGDGAHRLGWGDRSRPVLETARTAARHAPVFAYELLEDSEQFEGEVSYGAYHGWDLPFLWDTAIPFSQYPDLADMTAPQRRLSRAMIAYWTAFAHRGDPNHAGLPRWAGLRAGSSSVLGLDSDSIGRAPFAADHRCGFWDTL